MIITEDPWINRVMWWQNLKQIIMAKVNNIDYIIKNIF